MNVQTHNFKPWYLSFTLSQKDTEPGEKESQDEPPWKAQTNALRQILKLP